MTFILKNVIQTLEILVSDGNGGYNTISEILVSDVDGGYWTISERFG